MEIVAHTGNFGNDRVIWLPLGVSRVSSCGQGAGGNLLPDAPAWAALNQAGARGDALPVLPMRFENLLPQSAGVAGAPCQAGKHNVSKGFYTKLAIHADLRRLPGLTHLTDGALVAITY